MCAHAIGQCGSANRHTEVLADCDEEMDLLLVQRHYRCASTLGTYRMSCVPSAAFLACGQRLGLCAASCVTFLCVMSRVTFFDLQPQRLYQLCAKSCFLCVFSAQLCANCLWDVWCMQSACVFSCDACMLHLQGHMLGNQLHTV